VLDIRPPVTLGEYDADYRGGDENKRRTKTHKDTDNLCRWNEVH
jgi:hypothetical protein